MSRLKPSRPVRERLLETAERLFAEHGWHAVGIRTIATEAGVSLAALNYHFGDKEKLLAEIFSIRAKPIAEERLRLLETAIAQGAPSVEDVLEAFLRPSLTTASDPRFGGRTFVKLRARLAAESQSTSRDILSKEFDNSSRAFLTAFGRLLPELPRIELEWRFHFLLGTMIYTMANNGRIQDLTDGHCDPTDVEEALRHLVPFLAAGFRSSPIAIAALQTADGWSGQGHREPN
jgi:AcrR family transcriptional regulator